MNTDHLHRYLDVPFSLALPELLVPSDDNYVKTVDPDQIPPSLSLWLADMDVSYYPMIEFFHTAPYMSLPIHSDAVSSKERSFTYSNVTKLNFTWGHMASKTRWWRPKDPELLEKYLKDSATPDMQLTPGVEDENDPPHLYIEERHCELILEKVIDRPSLINAGQLHSTYNPTPVNRYTLSFLLTKPTGTCLNFSEALTQFKDWIVVDKR